ncbi:MAG: hypothetical protein ACOY40_14680 [Bacillota bacterium]
MAIKRYLLRRMLYLLPVMLGVSVITFGLINLAPGDPAELILRAGGVEPTREAVEALREDLGLNAPLYVQYGRWLWNVLHLDLGKSFRTGRPVAGEILCRFPATLELTCAAMALVVLFALPFGVLAALYRHALVDHLTRIGALVEASMPGFWLGLVLIYLFAVRLHLLPVMGRGGIDHQILPAITLAFNLLGDGLRDVLDPRGFTRRR